MSEEIVRLNETPEPPAPEIVCLDSPPTTAPTAQAAPIVNDPHGAWAMMMQGLRTKLLAGAAMRGESPLVDPIPGYTMELGEDKYGKPVVPALRGKYVRYAFDRYGRLSLGHGKGRLKRHFTKTQLAMKSAAIEQFRAEYTAYESMMRIEDAKDGKAFQGVTEEEIMAFAPGATKRGVRAMRKQRRAEARAKRARQQASRKINFGMLPGNSDRRAHAHGAGTTLGAMRLFVTARRAALFPSETF